jgi:hypothetical protein
LFLSNGKCASSVKQFPLGLFDEYDDELNNDDDDEDNEEGSTSVC